MAETAELKMDSQLDRRVSTTDTVYSAQPEWYALWPTHEQAGTASVAVWVSAQEATRSCDLAPWGLTSETGPSEMAGPLPASDVTDCGSTELDGLVMAAELGNEVLFVRALSQINWAHRPASDYVRGVRLALAAGAHLQARSLATQGAQRYPDHVELQKMARILAPPRVVRTGLPADPSLRADRQWLQANRSRYAGRWIALKQGRLLAAGETVSELRAKLGDLRGTLVTKVS